MKASMMPGRPTRSTLIVILNDNGMSISENVGGISTHLTADPLQAPVFWG